METALVFHGIMMFFVTLFWMIRFNNIYWDVLKFRDMEDTTDYIMAILTWMWLLGGCTAVIYLSIKYISPLTA